MAQLELPEFVVKPSQDFKGWLVVTCPRPDCGDIFLVRRKKWQEQRFFTIRSGGEVPVNSRPCPYCFKAARLPVRYTRRVTTTTRRQG